MNSFLSHFDGIPILTLEEKLPGYPCIRTDNSRGMRDAIEHLIKEHKRKHICFVAGKDDNTDSNLRLKIYREVLSENGLSVEDRMIIHGDFAEYCQEETAQLLDVNPDADAIVFANDHMAIGGYAELKSEEYA